MKTFILFTAYSLYAALPVAAAEAMTVRMWAVAGKATYSHTQSNPVGEKVSFRGKADIRGGGAAREIFFHSLLYPAVNGQSKMDYQVEIAGVEGGNPPFQAMGKVLLRPGKPVLAVKIGGWKYFLELKGKASYAGEYPEEGMQTIVTRLNCSGTSFPANFNYLPGEEYYGILYTGSGDTTHKFTISLRPGSHIKDEPLTLQYSVSLKEDDALVATKSGSLKLDPGGEGKASTGNGCAFSAKLVR